MEDRPNHSYSQAGYLQLYVAGHESESSSLAVDGDVTALTGGGAGRTDEGCRMVSVAGRGGGAGRGKGGGGQEEKG